MERLLAATPPASVQRSLLDYLQAGGPIGYLLIGLSFLAVGLLVAHFLKVRPQALAPVDVVAELEAYLAKGDTAGAIAYCKQEDHRCFITNTFGAALTRCSRSTFGLLELRTALEEAGAKELDRLIRTTDGIAIIAAIGPMMGLLGTTIGMIGAFASIGTLEGAARSNELSNFMSLALVTTAQGLIVAIPCTVLYTILRRRVERLAMDVGETVEELAAVLSGGGARAGAPSQAT
ncbi:MAG: MotA/TolQ/ExbB proton channel family protein [Phycisphaerales bacterium]|nr:MotA/TolQ/ExbB proton channel family protein [Phycisphaerales bacterium]